MVDLPHRNIGCEAKLEDDGHNQKIPVCMGGVAIGGCSNVEKCLPQFAERKNDPSSTYFPHIDDAGLVSTVTILPREYIA